MDLQLIKASPDHKQVISNLMQFYMYDFSEYVALDVDEDGLFAAYTNLDSYWQEENTRYPYIITCDEKYAGFVLVRLIEATERHYFSIAEFFVMKRYRREGMGTSVAKLIFGLHKGQWEVFQKESNTPAQTFWKKVIDEYTNGKFAERFEDGKRIQDFENSLMN